MQNVIIRVLCILIIACFTAFAEEQALDAIGKAMNYYKATILEKENGVYENEGILFIHSKIVIDKASKRKSASKMKAKAEALLGINNLLRKWAMEQTAAAREAEPEPKQGILFVKSFVEKFDPDWQFADWNIQLKMHTFQDGDVSGSYIVGMAVEKQTVLEAIPKDYSLRCPEDKLFKMLTLIAERCQKTEKQKRFFLKRCGVPDLYTEGEPEDISVKEYAEFQKKLEDYLAKSPFISQIRQEAEEIRKPKVTTKETVEENSQKTHKVKTVVTVTVEDVPKMHDLLLAGGKGKNEPFSRLESGDKAISLLQDNSIDAKDKEHKVKEALMENPGDKELWYHYGHILMDRGEHFAAVSCYRNALSLDKSFVLSIVHLASSYQHLGFRNLSLGMATLALGLAKDEASISDAKSLINNMQ